MGTRSLVAWSSRSSGRWLGAGARRSEGGHPDEDQGGDGELRPDGLRRGEEAAQRRRSRSRRRPSSTRIRSPRKVYLDLGIASFADGDTGRREGRVPVGRRRSIRRSRSTPRTSRPSWPSSSSRRAARRRRRRRRRRPTAGRRRRRRLRGGEGPRSTRSSTPRRPARASPIEALVGGDVTPSKVAVMYRPEGATDFVEVKLTKQGDCKYTGAIPRSAMKGSLVHYYVARVRRRTARPIAGKGSSGSPNIIELVAAAPRRRRRQRGSDQRRQEAAEGRAGGGGGGGVSGGVIVGGKPREGLRSRVAGGTGFGYVTGKTEGGNTVENCCIGNSLVVLHAGARLLREPAALDRHRRPHRHPDRRERRRADAHGSTSRRRACSACATRCRRAARASASWARSAAASCATRSSSTTSMAGHGHRHRRAGPAARRRRHRLHEAPVGQRRRSSRICRRSARSRSSKKLGSAPNAQQRLRRRPVARLRRRVLSAARTRRYDSARSGCSTMWTSPAVTSAALGAADSTTAASITRSPPSLR